MKNGITDPTELVHVYAQMSHESGSFRYDTEIASGEKYETMKIQVRFLEILNLVTDLGSREEYIRLTGRWNYGHFGKLVGVDLD